MELTENNRLSGDDEMNKEFAQKLLELGKGKISECHFTDGFRVTVDIRKKKMWSIRVYCKTKR